MYKRARARQILLENVFLHPDDPAGDVIGDDLDAEEVGLVAQVTCLIYF